MNKRQRNKRAYGLKGVIQVERWNNDWRSHASTYTTSLSDYSEEWGKSFLRHCYAISVTDLEYLLEKIQVLQGENKKQAEALGKRVFKTLGR